MINILVVDDSKLARRRTIQTIEKTEIAHTIVAEAVDGVDGLTKFNELKVDLVITDIEMPNMNGMQLAEEIRAVNSSVEIIVISSIASEQVKQKLKSDKFTDFIKKPIDARKLEILLLKAEYSVSKGEN